MPCCLHPWTMSMLSGDNRNQRPQNLGNLQGILQQVMEAGAEPWLLCHALDSDCFRLTFPYPLQLSRARTQRLPHSWTTPVSVHSVSSMGMLTLR